jgi:hypothetical protein
MSKLMKEQQEIRKQKKLPEAGVLPKSAKKTKIK